MITVRRAEDIYQTEGDIKNGTFRGRWHFSFGEYYDPGHKHFGTLRMFNDDTLSPGAIRPLHRHRDIEVVTYCVAGEFRHADEHGKGGVLKKGWVQHTTVGKGMFHAEINNRPDQLMRFVQMWFVPRSHGLPPSVEQKEVERAERTNRLLALVSNEDEGGLRIESDAKVYSCFLQQGNTVAHRFAEGRGGYLYVLEGGDVSVNDSPLRHLDAAAIRGEAEACISARGDAELLLVVVPVE